MALVIISGEIDLSVAAIIAFSSTMMGLALQFGVGTPGLVAVGILTGLICGAFNGVLVTGLGLPSIVVTIGTMSFFRGLSFIVLGDQAYKGYPGSFAFFGQGYVWWVISFEFVLFLIMAVLFYILLHRTNFGRWVFVIGNNPVAAEFSGVRVRRIKLILFCLTGIMSGIAAVLLTSRLGSTRPSIAQGWELEVITMVVLGGVSILGGRGQYYRRGSCRFYHGVGDFRLGAAECAGHRDVYCHWRLVDCGHCPADSGQTPAAKETLMTEEKFAFTMRLNAGMQAEYKRRHDAIWPALSQALTEAGVRDYSIHLDPETDILFAVLWRRTDHGLDALATTEIMQEWWAFMADIMHTHADNAPVTKPLETVFHMA